MDRLVKISYAAAVAVSQAIATFAQIREDQKALARMTDKQINQLLKGAEKAPIGFTRAQEAARE